MIEIDALYILLLFESVAVFVALGVILLIRGRKTRALYRTAARDLAESRSAEESLRQQLAESLARSVRGTDVGEVQVLKDQVAMLEADVAERKKRTETLEGKSADFEKDTEEVQALKDQVAMLEADVAERKKRIEMLEAKFADLEKEYLILYQQQQAR